MQQGIGNIQFVPEAVVFTGPFSSGFSSGFETTI
jgi:hypothetical protein